MIAYVLVTALITSAKTSKLQLYFSTILGFEHIQNGSIIMIPQRSHAESALLSIKQHSNLVYGIYNNHIYSHTFTKSWVLPSQRVERHRQITHPKQQLIPNKS